MGGRGAGRLVRDLPRAPFGSCRPFPLVEPGSRYHEVCKLCVYSTWFVKLKVKSVVYWLYFQICVVLVPSAPTFAWDYR